MLTNTSNYSSKTPNYFHPINHTDLLLNNNEIEVNNGSKLDSLWSEAIRNSNNVLSSETLSGENQVHNPIKLNITSLAKENRLPFSPFKYIYLNDRMNPDYGWLRRIDEELGDPDAFHLIPTGISTSYLIKDKFKKPLGIYKPNDEAGYAKNNLKGFDVNDFDGDEATVREVGARLIGNDFCNVPELHQIKLIVNGALQQGSLQKFADHDGSFNDLATSSAKFLFKLCGVDILKETSSEDEKAKLENFLSNPKNVWKYKKMVMNDAYITRLKMSEQIQRIGLLDILIQNPDRNANNLLYKNENEKIKLIAIDHNLAFPKNIQPLPLDILWLQSLYASEPFDAETKKFVSNLNIKKICRQLAKVGMSEERIVQFEMMAHFVKKGVKYNLSLLELGLMTTRLQSGKESEIERIINRATIKTTTIDHKAFLNNYKLLLDETFEWKKVQLAKEGVTNLSRYYVPLLKKETYETFASYLSAETNFNKFMAS